MSYNYQNIQCISGSVSVTDGIASLTDGNLYCNNVISNHDITSAAVNTNLLELMLCWM